MRHGGTEGLKAAKVAGEAWGSGRKRQAIGVRCADERAVVVRVVAAASASDDKARLCEALDLLLRRAPVSKKEAA